MRIPAAALVLAALLAALPLPSALRAQTAGPPATDAAPEAPAPRPAPLRVALETSLGRIVLALDAERAPATVANFLAYVDAGHYNGTVFHRVIPGVLVQGGAYTPDLQPKPERAPIPNEAGNGLPNRRGSLAAARRPDDAGSATLQFFINLADNPQFDPVPGAGDTGAGYAVFGEVVEGMEVLDRIAAVETGPAGPFPSRVPKMPVVIERASRLEEVRP
ncbi:peptidylprolyl isomerase [Silanimonas lenta]|uniref:peptidylprolyl isomerase n=1 Tax=Silanimonas lenta TaxID=265429 RepID=UPI00041BEC25